VKEKGGSRKVGRKGKEKRGYGKVEIEDEKGPQITPVRSSGPTPVPSAGLSRYFPGSYGAGGVKRAEAGCWLEEKNYRWKAGPKSLCVS
jgi:hypothetical protein